MRRIISLLLLASTFVLAGAQNAEYPLLLRTMTSGDFERVYNLYVPVSYTGDTPVALIVALHGRGGTGESIAYQTDLSAVAAENGFIAVYPDGVDREWKYFGGILDAPSLNQPDDVAFLNDLVDDVAAQYTIDPARVYLIGFSNGGFMAYRMACASPNRYAAFGIAAAVFYPEMELPCLEAPARPMIVSHGTADANIRWDGITHQPVAGLRVSSRTVLESVSFFAGRNGCNVYGAQSTDVTASSEETHVILFDFARCITGQPVRFYAVIDGGHTWPGVDRLPRGLAGPVNMDIDLTREMWAFFEANPLGAALGEDE